MSRLSIIGEFWGFLNQRKKYWLMPIVSIVPAQLFTYHLALARGGDPAGRG